MRSPDGEETETVISAQVSDRLKAIDLLGKYGGIEKLTLEVPPPVGGIAEASDEELLRVLYARAERLKSLRERAETLRAHGVNLEALSA